MTNPLHKMNFIITISILFMFIGCQNIEKRKNIIKPIKHNEEIDSTISSINQLNYTNTYPYSQTSSIEIFNYPNRHYWDAKKEKVGLRPNDTIIKNGKLNFDQKMIYDRIKLTNKQSKKLFQLLHNMDCVNDMTASCFDPRDMIVFYDKNNKPFEYIEICFGCSYYRSGEKVPIINLCPSKTKLIVKEFTKFGLKRGDFNEIENKLLEKYK